MSTHVLGKNPRNKDSFCVTNENFIDVIWSGMNAKHDLDRISISIMHYLYKKS